MVVRKRKRKHNKQKRVPQRIMVFTIVSSLLLGGGVTTLAQDGTFESKIQKISSSIMLSLHNKINYEFDSLSSNYSSSIEEYVEMKVTDMQAKLLQHTEKERLRAQKDLEEYLSQKKHEVNEEISISIHEQKKNITHLTDQLIEEEKKKIDIEFQNTEGVQPPESVVGDKVTTDNKDNDQTPQSSKDEQESPIKEEHETVSLETGD